MKLGKFTQDKDGNFHGKIRAYGLPETSVILTEQTSQNGKPYYSIVGDPLNAAFDGGAAYPKQKGKLEYLSVTLDSPVFPVPVNAGLFQDKANPEIFNLVWDRPQPKATLTAEATTAEQGQPAPAAQKAETQKRSFFNRGHNASM